MKYIGRRMEYKVNDGSIRVATIKGIEFHQLLKKPVFIGLSPFGNRVTLTRDEIHKIG
jgi:hypothetical protein